MVSMKPDAEFELGEEVKHDLSGREGVVVSIAEHLSGCTRIGVLWSDDDTEETFYYEPELESLGSEMWSDEFEVVGSDAKLGQVVEDDLTGFEGVASSITFSAFNCPRVAIEPTEVDGPEKPDREWFDEPRVNVVRSSVERYGEEDVMNASGANKDVSRKQNKE